MSRVEDVLTSFSTTNSLSANQGRVLKGYVDELDVRLTAVEDNPVNIQSLSSSDVIEIIGE